MSIVDEIAYQIKSLIRAFKHQDEGCNHDWEVLDRKTEEEIYRDWNLRFEQEDGFSSSVRTVISQPDCRGWRTLKVCMKCQTTVDSIEEYKQHLLNLCRRRELAQNIVKQKGAKK